MIVITGPSETQVSITKGSPFEGIIRGLYVGGAGDVTGKDQKGVAHTFKNVPAGYILPVCFSTIESTGTDATDLVGLY